MKQIIKKEEVSAAIEQLTAQGKRPTLAAIHGVLNHRGSMSTLVRLKAELQEASKPASGDSPEALMSFRETWLMAVAEGRRQEEALVAELRENLNAILADNERLEGLVLASQNRGQDLEVAKSLAESELKEFRAQVKADLDQARTSAAEANAKATEVLGRLAETQAKHTTQMAAMQAERDEAVMRAHQMEIKLTRALALLEAGGSSPCGNVWLNQNS
ncbi:MAG TPA: DNA-binding protein [Terriglobia bacterium]|nr:DNA-binding protein [Terriglobia bacterium]